MPILLVVQVAWRAQQPPAQATIGPLPPPPPVAVLEAAALGEPVPVAGLLNLWLQAADDGAGASLPFAQLDYARLEAWLETLLALDPAAAYPLLAASHIYAQVPDPARQRRMLDFVYRAFLADPDRRWRWLAHAALLARHRLHDTPLALHYARALARHARAPEVPAWARELSVLLLADMGELEAARVELGALLASGSLTDPRERQFLTQRLLQAETHGADENPPPPSKTQRPQPHP